MANNKYTAIIAIIFVLMQFSGLLIYYDNVHIEVHDNLDSVFVWMKILNDYDLFFSIGNETAPFLGGISRHNLPSELQLANLIYYFFEPLDAYFIVYFTKVLLGASSFWLLTNYLLDKYVIDSAQFKTSILVAALAFGLLPGYANLYFAQATLPLVCYLFLRTINEKKIWLFLSLLTYPILSELPRYGMFILAIMGLFFIYALLKKNGKRKAIFLSIVLLSVGYIITEYHFFMAYLLSDGESIKATLKTADVSITFIFKKFIIGGLKGQYHAQSVHHIIILPTLLYVSISLYRKKISTFGFNKQLIYISLFITINAFIYSLSYSALIRDIVGLLSPLKGWNYGRTIWLNPLLWHLLFVFCLIILIKNKRAKTANVLVILQVLVILIRPSYNNDFSNTLRCEFKQCTNSLSYKFFFSADDFDKVKLSIEYAGEPVLAFGMHPSILNFNGFTTLDGYHNAYTLDYKVKFRTIITPALDESQLYKRSFDNGGARAYLFADTVNGQHHFFTPYNNYSDAPVNLLMNTDAATELGAQYIISLYELNIDNLPGIFKIADIKGEHSPYHIRVYSLNNKP
jgi:hypothetical protein